MNVLYGKAPPVATEREVFIDLELGRRIRFRRSEPPAADLLRDHFGDPRGDG